jgi:hypothetical protein
MTQTIKILIVEDSKLDQQIYLDTIKNLNEDLTPHFKIDAVIKSNKHDGLFAINKMKDELNGAFIDLKLSTGQAAEVNEGNDLIEEIYQKLRFPIVVLTNTPGSFSNKFKKSLFLQVITKADANFEEIFLNFIDIYKTGITNILGRRGLVEQMLDEIFWNNISATLVEWINIPGCEKPLLRYTLTHLQEHLEISDDGTEFDTVFPIENYIKPSIKQYFFCGDIIYLKTNRAKRFVILTPACDLAPHGIAKTPKTKDVLLADLNSLSEGVFNENVTAARKEAKTQEEIKKVEIAKSDLRKILGNNFSPKYYYLPNTSVIEGGLINFQRLSSIKYSALQSDYEKQATISIQFVKDIIAKFSYYYSRQGSPDFNFEELLVKHLM